MFAINRTWLGPDLYKYRACLDFIEIQGSYSGENLAESVFNKLTKLKIQQKLLTITGDNAANNNTLCQHLYKQLSQLYNAYDSEIQYSEGTMRFKGEQSQIRCLAYILNLTVKAILYILGSSIQKEAVAFLDRVATNK
jgi:hypothetical protein